MDRSHLVGTKMTKLTKTAAHACRSEEVQRSHRSQAPPFIPTRLPAAVEDMETSRRRRQPPRTAVDSSAVTSDSPGLPTGDAFARDLSFCRPCPLKALSSLAGRLAWVLFRRVRLLCSVLQPHKTTERWLMRSVARHADSSPTAPSTLVV